MIIYKIYGVIGGENDGPRHKEYEDVEYTEEELSDSVYNITIEMYGDAPTTAFLQIHAVNLESGLSIYENISEEWKFNLQRIFWNE